MLMWVPDLPKKKDERENEKAPGNGFNLLVKNVVNHTFYIDVSAVFRVLLFIPRPSSEHMCFRQNTHALNIDDLPAQTYKMGLLFSPKHVTMGLLFCPNIFSFTQSLHYRMIQLRVHGFNLLSQIHLSLRQSSLHP